ncbi:U3 snoRNP protein [Verticillium dahliae VdLs.17]|uniref:U3 snoRNP protein n=1 Tax=Verticillium dahliae (strain VdLs.17 / ATCC MYA-4575 / FGSC 10137) TaxID=498257 RepID=G2XIH0_VERDV|nr:U3 snoRNP protein [Verticillium dahliae VdLs.17]EGY19618.1 U3 snoRNP protein [Verticillium dahliae VdLs.17]
MAGVAEKARFYLERSVPQLREWEAKEIFTKEEIRNIVQRRSDFEHRALAPGVQPTDFTNYVAWEISLDALRVKRCERLKIRHVASQHATQARVLAIYERAVTKRPASKELWLDYLTYTERIRATKRWRRTMTRALRLMPRDAELWVLAGRRAAKNGDMGTARGYFMRGCRFCTVDGGLWVEYARCEMEWLAKMERNRKDSKKGGRCTSLFAAAFLVIDHFMRPMMAAVMKEGVVSISSLATGARLAEGSKDDVRVQPYSTWLPSQNQGPYKHLHAVKDVLVLGTADAPEPDWAVEFTLKCNVNTDKIKPVDVDVAGVAVSLTDVVVG